MHSFLGLGANHVLFAALISWFVAQALKIPIYHHVEHVWDFSRFHGSGGMPSSHSAMVTGTALMIGGLYGPERGGGHDRHVRRGGRPPGDWHAGHRHQPDFEGYAAQR